MPWDPWQSETQEEETVFYHFRRVTHRVRIERDHYYSQQRLPDHFRTGKGGTRACMLSCFSWVRLFNRMDCSLPGSSIIGIFQARTPEWVAHPPPGDLPDPGMEPESLRSPTLAGRFFTTSATWEICSLEEQDSQDHWAELEQYLSGDLLGSGEAWIVFLEPVMQYFIRYIFILLSWKLLPSRYFKLIVSYIDVWLLTAISSFGYSELN